MKERKRPQRSMVIHLAVADQLRKRRAELGLSLREAAERADMDISQYLVTERGNTDMRLSSLLRILSALDLEFHFKKRSGR